MFVTSTRTWAGKHDNNRLHKDWTGRRRLSIQTSDSLLTKQKAQFTPGSLAGGADPAIARLLNVKSAIIRVGELSGPRRRPSSADAAPSRRHQRYVPPPAGSRTPRGPLARQSRAWGRATLFRSTQCPVYPAASARVVRQAGSSAAGQTVFHCLGYLGPSREARRPSASAFFPASLQPAGIQEIQMVFPLIHNCSRHQRSQRRCWLLRRGAREPGRLVTSQGRTR